MANTVVRTLYTHPACSYSDALRQELVSDGLVFTEVDISERLDLIPEVLALTGGERITPVMVTGDIVMVGFRGAG